MIDVRILFPLNIFGRNEQTTKFCTHLNMDKVGIVTGHFGIFSNSYGLNLSLSSDSAMAGL